MHANYHRKDSAIMMEGFQRYRATEDCGSPKCQFYQQRTTHFHCRRTGCSFTFKNKADMGMLPVAGLHTNAQTHTPTTLEYFMLVWTCLDKNMKNVSFLDFLFLQFKFKTAKN